jgi:hypothetical protein
MSAQTTGHYGFMPKWARDEDHGRSLLSGVRMTSRLASAIPATPDGNKIMRMARMVRLLSSDIRNWRGQFFMSPDNCQHVDVEPHSEDLYVRSRGEWSSKPRRRSVLSVMRHVDGQWAIRNPLVSSAGTLAAFAIGSLFLN